MTEQMRVEEKLRESEERYRELFDDSPVAIWEEDWSEIKQMLDELARSGVSDWRTYFNDHPDQLKRAYDLARVTEISRATVELYRAPNKIQLAQMTTSDFIIAEELDAFLEILRSFAAGQMTFEIESKDMAVDGTDMIVRRRVVVPPKHQAYWSRVIYAIEDITERERVGEQLRQAQKMEAVGRLTGGVAHDFNNLLAVINGNCELLKYRLGQECIELDTIVRATKRGADLTRHLLAFSRQQTLRPEVVDVASMVSKLSDMLTRTLGETVEIAIRTPPNLSNAFVDPGLIEVALLNLALNARDAMPGGGCLTIECANIILDEDYVSKNPGAETGAYVVLALSDEGTGMTADVQARAFEPFYTTKEVGQGSGLGLSMVFGFAKQSGGHVAIYSEIGRGTTVKLYLPRAMGEVGRVEAPEDQVPRGQGELILVVEDDLDVGELLANLLDNLGYRVVVVSSAASAKKSLVEGPTVDLILSDVVLPGGISGPELAKQIRDSHPELKVIFMSGYPAEAVKRAGFLESDFVLLNKPFEMQKLAEAVREALD